MNNRSPHGVLFAAIAIIFPLLYFMMYVPIWGSNTLTLTSITVIILFIFQLVAACMAVLRIVFLLCQRSLSGVVEIIFNIIAVLSVLLTCFAGFVFTLELLGVPWFPAQR